MLTRLHHDEFSVSKEARLIFRGGRGGRGGSRSSGSASRGRPGATGASNARGGFSAAAGKASLAAARGAAGLSDSDRKAFDTQGEGDAGYYEQLLAQLDALKNQRVSAANTQFGLVKQGQDRALSEGRRDLSLALGNRLGQSQQNLVSRGFTGNSGIGIQEANPIIEAAGRSQQDAQAAYDLALQQSTAARDSAINQANLGYDSSALPINDEKIRASFASAAGNIGGVNKNDLFAQQSVSSLDDLAKVRAPNPITQPIVARAPRQQQYVPGYQPPPRINRTNIASRFGLASRLARRRI